MRIKAGVVVDGMHYAVMLAAVLYDWLRQENGLGEGTLTGGREPAAGRVKGTLHPGGRAVDLRTNDLPGGAGGEHARELAQVLAQQLGRQYDVVLERDHVHVEFVG